MNVAARAIIIEDDKILAMFRNKYGSEYFTLVGGRVSDGETPEQALVREVREETGLEVTAYRLLYIEEHAAPLNQQYIYLCHIAPHGNIAVQANSEEGMMNQIDINTHQPQWVPAASFGHLQFRTPQLQAAIVHALKHGFPAEPQKL